MDGSTRGSLEWPFINETRWLCADFGEVSHRIMLHAELGIVFDSHGQSLAPLLAIEAQMVSGKGFCACYLLAMWWMREVSISQVSISHDATTSHLRVAQIFMGESLVCRVRGQPIDMLFFRHLIEMVSPRATVVQSNHVLFPSGKFAQV